MSQTEDVEVDESSIGVFPETFQQPRADGLTLDDIGWAIEQGAKSEQEIFELVREDKERTEHGNAY